MNPSAALTLLPTKGWLYAGVVVAVLLMSTAVTGATTGTVSTGPSATPTATASSSPLNVAATTSDTATPTAASIGLPGGGGGKNIVQVTNQTDDKLRVDGKVQLNRIPGPSVQPVNLASAYSSCTNCQTLAVALQINLISTTAVDVQPQNAAIAVNYRCTTCVTIADAYQYVLTVDDPTQVPPEVNQLMAQMQQELHTLQGQQGLTVQDAEQQVNRVITQFQDLATSLNQKRDETAATTSPNATPGATGTPDASLTVTPAAAPSVSDTPTAEPSPSDTPRATDTATPSPTPTDTATLEPSPTATTS